MRHRGGPFGLVGALVVVLLSPACSSDDPTPATTSATSETGTATGGPADGVVTVTIAGFAFEPSAVTLTEGDTLTVTNQDSAAHTFTMDDGTIDESLEPGQQVELTPDAEGPFHCEIHPSMTGTLSFG